MSSMIVDERGKFRTLPLLLAFVFFFAVFAVWQNRYAWFPELAEKYLGPEPEEVVVTEPAPEPVVETTETVTAAVTDSPAPEPETTPEPVATPEPKPEPAVAEVPAPKKPLLEDPEQWPETVTLRKTLRFPALSSDGRPIGFIGAPEGTTVELVKVVDGKLLVRHRSGGTLTIDPADTDLLAGN